MREIEEKWENEGNEENGKRRMWGKAGYLIARQENKIKLRKIYQDFARAL